MTRERTVFAIAGVVQGVGFRPHVARLATQHALGGWVANVAGGVRIEAEGEPARLAVFATALVDDAPPRACIERVAHHSGTPLGEMAFRIRKVALSDRDTGTGLDVSSDHRSNDDIDPGNVIDADLCARIVPVATDGATCAACLNEILDPHDRRYRYPFTSCTDCGPRYSILESLPYERANTSMRHFTPCSACLDETTSSSDRRFHAQANACPACGPVLSLLAPDGSVQAHREAALEVAVAALRDGAILALKGLGGYQLLVDARRSRAVRELRRRKARPHKPFAVLLGDLETVALHCELSAEEAAAIGTSAAPIVLLRRRRSPAPGIARIARAVAPGSALLGVMLPCTPLHHLLAREFAAPLVATSGNRIGEPMATDQSNALTALRGIADLFLTHDRSIVRALDDSLERVTAGGVLPLRRARGHAPMSIRLPHAVPPVLAFGGHQKTTIALGAGQEIVVSEHLGDLDSTEGRRRHSFAVDELPRLHGVRPTALARDTHPDYASTRSADTLGARTGLPVVAVPHHLAHVLSCLADNGVEGPALGVAWDGSGHGTDGTLWGGEFLHLDGTGVRRVAHLFPFRLPGGERAVREPRRAALGALLTILGERRFVALAEGRTTDTDPGDFDSVRSIDAVHFTAIDRSALALLATFEPAERQLLAGMVTVGVNAPLTSSAGRLFDAVAALLGLARQTSFEGQAAAMLEQVCDESCYQACSEEATIGLELHCVLNRMSPDTTRAWRASDSLSADELMDSDTPLIVDWRPMLAALLAAHARGVPKSMLARDFHRAMIRSIVDVARHVGEPRVALTGGCFQNARLLDGTCEALVTADFEPLRHHRVPPNDGGLALGQALAAVTTLEGRTV